MSEHSLHLDGHPLYDWRLSCDHEHGADRWRSVEEEGTGQETDDCWLMSWWDEFGVDLICDNVAEWSKVTTLPIPVDVRGNGWAGGEPMLIPVKEEDGD